MAKPSTTPVVLASRSPQRSALLQSLGLRFEVIEPEVDEEAEGDPREVVAANAQRKAESVVPRAASGSLVIACDTEVAIGGSALGQPANEREARWCLNALSGRTHEVLGGLVLLGPDREGERPARRAGVETTRVEFAELGPELIDAYLCSGEWRGRAGGYAVQGLGSALVAGIEGDVSNVIGLPIRLLARLAPELLRTARHN